MEDVLDLYAEPFDPKRPVVCFDERPVQLIAETRAPLPAAPGRPGRVDYEYRRAGVANLFVVFAPHHGWRDVHVTERRTKLDFAARMRALVDVFFPRAETIRVVLDNLNTHTPAALYEAFPPATAQRIAKKLEFHHTPAHGSWLNMAEAEIAVLSRQALDQRLGDVTALKAVVGPYQERRNAACATVHWRFTTRDARRKLKRLYPTPSLW